MGSLGSVITLLGDLRDEFGLSETQLGLIVGAGFFAAFVTRSPWPGWPTGGTPR